MVGFFIGPECLVLSFYTTFMLNRIKIIQRLIKVIGAKNYLEIGVNNGACFLRLRGANKIAVDPSFRIPLGRKLKYFIKNPTNLTNRYFEVTSDDFFASQKDFLNGHKPKVVLVDGLHTYKQALRDVFNSLEFLDGDGIILMHDCNPETEGAAWPADSIDRAKASIPDYNGIWNGDVWKAIVHMRSLCPELQVFVLDCDHGIGVIRIGTARDRLNFSEEQISRFSFTDLSKNRREFLNLKSPDFFETFIEELIVERDVKAKMGSRYFRDESL
jgi:hypothetical protein